MLAQQNTAQIIDVTPVIGARKVDPTGRGSTNNTVSSQWFKRPADQRFLSLSALRDHTRAAYMGCRSETIQARDLHMVAPEPTCLADTHKLAVAMPGDHVAIPTNWSFGQTCSLVKAPAGYLSTLPSQMVADNLNWGLRAARDEPVKVFHRTDGTAELRAVTGPQYGRIPDYEVAEAVMQFAGDGTGDTGWKVPGVMDWATHIYDPHAPVTVDTTTLFASDRDVFMFLVDDLHPIEVGKLPDGSPDYLSRGFYCWNSEVGAGTCGIAVFYLRAVCCNRILWGVENFEEVSIRHTKNAPARFMAEVMPALASFANGSSAKLVEGVQKAKAAIIAKDDEEALDFLRNRSFSKNRAKEILEAVEREEGRPARDIWAITQGITAVARSIEQQDARLDMERQAKLLLDRVA